MKRFIYSVLIAFSVLPGTETTQQFAIPASKEKKENCGYTVIKFGKGINCDGDTIMVNQVHQRMAVLR